MAGGICERAEEYLNNLAKLAQRIDRERVEAFADALFHAWKDDRCVFVFGNGGSAATANHMVCDFVKTAAVDGQRRLRAFCLVDSMGMGTALANDIGYEDTFRYPLETYSRPGDVVVGLSGSGNSRNVLRACRWARENGVMVVALSGFDGGELKNLADLHINVPSDNFGLIEDLHLVVGHSVAQILKSRVLRVFRESPVSGGSSGPRTVRGPERAR